MFSAFEIIALNLLLKFLFIYHENTCDLQSTCYPKISHMNKRDVFQLNFS